MAFVVLPEVTFEGFPFAPTPEEQYLIKDLAILFAPMAIGASVREEHTAAVRH